MANTRYDVAISFLSADEPIAAALYERLSEGLEVFFFARCQEELAGTDGMESMRKPFLDGSRVVVVLYRERWGETPWTRVEQTAIQERCLKHGWKGLFFVVLEKGIQPTRWLPDTHVWFSYPAYGLEQAVGAIKARVQEAGGSITEPSVVRHAEIARLETEFQRERALLRSPFCGDDVAEEAAALFGAIDRKCAEVSGSGNATIQFASDPRQCHLRNGLVSVIVRLTESASNGPGLVVALYSKRLEMRGERLAYMGAGPKVVDEEAFLPDLSRTRQHGWGGRSGSKEFLSSDALADRVVMKFIDHAARAERRRSRVTAADDDDD